jgi:hypothetical protein
MASHHPNGGQNNTMLNTSDSQNYSMSSSRTMQDKRSMKITFLESENKNLVALV